MGCCRRPAATKHPAISLQDYICDLGVIARRRVFPKHSLLGCASGATPHPNPPPQGGRESTIAWPRLTGQQWAKSDCYRASIIFQPLPDGSRKPASTAP